MILSVFARSDEPLVVLTPLLLRHSGLEPESSPPRVCGAEEFFAIKDLIALDTGSRPV